MYAKTAFAVAASALALPGAAAAAVHHSSEPGQGGLHPSGRLVHDEDAQQRLARANVRLARREARLHGHRLPRGYARRVRDDAVTVLRARNQRLRRRVARLKRAAAGTALTGSTASAPLQAIAACESGGSPSAIGGGGQYRGKYQFSMSTWASVGGSGDPAAASEAEQDRRAAMLYTQAGASAWPVCGR
jgi:hypothetical protein